MYNSKMPSDAELPSSRQLLRSTFLAAVTAGVLLVTTVLPAEYAIDPTGIGRVLGLTEMGEIKVSLAAEAAQEAISSTSPAPTAVPSLPAQPSVGTVSNPPPNDQQRAAATAEPPASPAAPAPAMPQASPAPAGGPAAVMAAAPTKSDEMTITLKPGQGAEIKLEMRKGTKANFIWSSAGGPVNYDTHGDPYNAPKNFYHGYGKGSQVNEHQGVLEAAFDGNHGWFWRNRGNKPVTVTLRTNGDYIAIKRVI